MRGVGIERYNTGMPIPVARRLRELLMRSLVYLPIFALLVFQFLEAKRSSDKSIGITVEPRGDMVLIATTRPEGPADRGGLLAGDEVLAIAGQPVRSLLDYDMAATLFERGQAVEYQVRRDQQVLMLEIVPGAELPWVPVLLSFVLVTALLALAILSLVRRPGSVPATLLYRLLVLVALEVSLPISAVGAPVLGVVTDVASSLLNGAQFGTMLHLACVIPQRQSWLRRWPWVIPGLYGVGLGAGALTAITYLVEVVGERQVLPWDHATFRGPVQWTLMLAWAILMIVFLAIPARRHPTRQGRRQAGWMLLGALPWSLSTSTLVVLESLDREGPEWMYAPWFWRLTLMPLLLSIFVVLQMLSGIQKRVLLRLTSRLQEAGSMEKISELISRDLNRAFQTKCNYVFFREESSSDLTSVHSSGARVGVENIPESYEILRIANRKGEALVFPEDLADLLPVEEKRWLERLRANLIVPVTGSEHRLIGLLILGMKASEEPYIAYDFELLRSLAGQIALACENIGLHVQVHEQDRIQRDVLDRFEEQEIYLVKECPLCGRCYESTEQVCEKDGARLALTLPVERTIDNHYRLDRVLGKGGVAVVYRAFDQRLDRTVAVKVLARSVMDAPDASRRFAREARIVAQLAHPRIVTIYDFGKTKQGCAYLVMEYLEGATMGQTLRRRGPYSPEHAAELFDRILDGLGAAHRAGIVHRDLKPDNVLITGPESNGTSAVKLLDFGLAKFHAHSGVANTNLTRPGFVIGTLAYMAPEQLGGDEADERSDLFAIAVMVYEALAGRKPFKGRTPAQVLKSMASREVTIGEGAATAKLNAVLARCLDQDPTKRYASAEELRADLIPAIRQCPAPD